MSALLKKISGMKVTIIVIFWCMTGIASLSQSSDQVIKKFISNHIPVDNQNWGISQNQDNGYIYFANSEGLIEFNGISSKLFILPFRQTVRSVHVIQDGTIFTGSFEEFGYWKYNQEGNLLYSSLSTKVKIEKNDEIWKIYEDKGIIYFQSFTTIYSYNGAEVKAVKAPFTLLFLFKTGKGYIAQILENGLYWFDGGKFTFIRGSEIFSRKKVHAIIEIAENDYWICTANDGIFRFNRDQFLLQTSEISSFLKLQSCNAGLSLNDSLLVFGTIQNGVVLCYYKGEII